MNLTNTQNDILRHINKYHDKLEEMVNCNNPIRRAIQRANINELAKEERLSLLPRIRRLVAMGVAPQPDVNLSNITNETDRLDYLLTSIDEEVENKIESFKYCEMESYIYGDKNCGYKGLIDSVEIPSMVKGETPKRSADFIKKVDEAMDLNTGSPDMIMMAHRSRRGFTAHLHNLGIVIGVININGDRHITYNNIPIYATHHMSPDDTTLLFIDTSRLWIVEKYPLRFNVDKLSDTEFGFLLECEEYLMIDNPKHITALQLESMDAEPEGCQYCKNYEREDKKG